MWNFITNNFIVNGDGFGISWRVATFLVIFAWIVVAWFKVRVTKVSK